MKKKKSVGPKAATKPARAPAKPSPKPAKAAAKPSPKPAKPAKPASSGVVDVGARAPSFALPDQDGNIVSSASLAGKPYVLYFYPKDDTGGCTKEACGFRDERGFNGAGVRVIGASPDSPASHTRFRAKYGLTFTLLSDADKTLAQSYGVWGEKKNYGRAYLGIIRSTFLVGKDGKVKQLWRGVRIDGHVAAVLEAVRAL